MSIELNETQALFVTRELSHDKEYLAIRCEDKSEGSPEDTYVILWVSKEGFKKWSTEVVERFCVQSNAAPQAAKLDGYTQCQADVVAFLRKGPNGLYHLRHVANWIEAGSHIPE